MTGSGRRPGKMTPLGDQTTSSALGYKKMQNAFLLRSLSISSAFLFSLCSENFFFLFLFLTNAMIYVML